MHHPEYEDRGHRQITEHHPQSNPGKAINGIIIRPQDAILTSKIRRSWHKEMVDGDPSTTDSITNQPNGLSGMAWISPSFVNEYFPARIWSRKTLPIASAENSPEHHHSYLDHIHSE